MSATGSRARQDERCDAYQIQQKRNEDDLKHPLAGGRID